MKSQIFKILTRIAFSLFLTFSSCSTDSDADFLPAREIFNEGYGSDPMQTMDVFLPTERTREDTPLLIYIHGGAWIDGDKSEFLQVKAILEEQFPGYAFVSLNYRLYDFLTGKNGIEDQEQDIISALEYIESQLSNWNISDDLIISGASAGGHLALLHAYKNNTLDLKGAIAFFPPTDLIELYGFNNLTASALNELIGGSPSTAASIYQDLSPVRFVDAVEVPTIFFHGDLDNVVPISQSQILEDALRVANVRHQFTLVPGQGHGFTSETYTQLLKEAKEFIGEF
ncbi:prolyl oligopeptidase family serine peptidase [Algoriphagus sp. A40]|uniref:prolyl oligopeptidase family serine peptidase n=1 Tax=Algoriphagus sp. A40 TaxID=1945863 RepID=UPI000986C9A1|nr:prolyl oligopeptidase family serine peptidase [Algoriphagus sp. A40]OOG68076.1 hypothetical protein B0E43_22570 [Algoriphagus sp. A40]